MGTPLIFGCLLCYTLCNSVASDYYMICNNEYGAFDARVSKGKTPRLHVAQHLKPLASAQAPGP